MTVSVNTYFSGVGKSAFKFQIGPFVGIFSIVSCLQHLIVIVLVWRKKYYKNWIENGIGYIRWYEYGLSLGCMTVAIALICGIHDIGFLILIFLTNFVAHWFYLANDSVNQLLAQKHEKPDWHYFVLSLTCQFVVWLILFVNIIGRLSYALVGGWTIIILIGQ
jgi:hypothetical protein